MRRISIEEANVLSRPEFTALFGGLYERSPWVAEKAFDERPFGGLEDLRRALEKVVRGAPEEAKLELVRAHPDLAGKAAVAGELTKESAGEQVSAGLDRLSPEEYERFTRINGKYRRKFGMPMVVCVRESAGKEAILKDAEARLENTREEELERALAEVSKIARLRLGDLVGEAPMTPTGKE